MMLYDCSLLRACRCSKQTHNPGSAVPAWLLLLPLLQLAALFVSV